MLVFVYINLLLGFHRTNKYVGLLLMGCRHFCVGCRNIMTLIYIYILDV